MPARTPRLGLELLEARDTPTASAITADFNRTAVPAGDVLWFSSVGKVAGLGTGTTSLHLTGGAVSFTAGGTAYTVTVPDATVTFTPLATRATTSYTAGGWLVTAPLRFTGNVFLGGAALPLAGGLPGGVKGVTWRTDVTADAPNVSVSWKWGAAAYAAFGTPDAVGVKAVDDKKVDFYRSADPAGTPEAFKRFVVAGGTGNGGTNYTGGSSGAKTVVAGPYVPPVRTATLSGTVFVDANGDHLIDPSDFRYAGLEVDLVDANGVVTPTFTADDGTYSFANVAAGTYTVQVVITDPIDNLMLPEVGTSGGTVDPSWAAVTGVSLGSGATATGYNFGVWQSFA